MSDSNDPDGGKTEDPEIEAEIAAILDFEPVPRRFKRDDGWTPALQRKFILHLARTGSPGKACDALGKRRSGIDKLYKVAGADSFRAAWHKAVEIAEARAAERIEAEHAATAGLTAPFVDHRRKAASGPDAQPGPEISEEQKWDLIHSIGVRFMRKVAAERQARLAGEIVAADFYLRQVTFMEVLFDLSSEAMGWNAPEALRQLRRGEQDLLSIVSTPLADWMDASRREWWKQEGEPDRPPHPDVRFLERHSTAEGDPSTSSGQGYSTYADQHGYGATTTPARGFTQEEWAKMGHEEQRRARQAQFEADAEEQLVWEQRARAASHDCNRSSTVRD